MRSISKPWPPENVSLDGDPACTLREAERDLLAKLKEKRKEERPAHARDTFEALDKKKLRDVLYVEQRHICVYCERRIEEGVPTPRIDHWRPVSNKPELALLWKNLHLSCPTPDTCDVAKGDNRLAWEDADPDLPWPVDAPYDEWIGFTRGGEICVRMRAPIDDATRRALELALDHRDDGPRRRPSILNLNHPALVAARMAALDSERTRVMKASPNATLARSKRMERASHLLEQEKYEPFVSIRVAWLRGTMGANR